MEGGVVCLEYRVEHRRMVQAVYSREVAYGYFAWSYQQT